MNFTELFIFRPPPFFLGGVPRLTAAPGNATAVGLSAAGTQTWHATKNAQRGLRDYGAAVRRTAKDWAEALRDPDWRQAGMGWDENSGVNSGVDSVVNSDVDRC